MAARSRMVFLAAAWVAVASLNAYIIVPAPVFLGISETFGVGNAAAGGLVSILLLTAILIQVPGAYLIDRLSNRRIVAVSALGLTLASLPAMLHSYDALLASRAIAGLFVPLIFVSSANLVAGAFPEARVRALGIYLSSPPAGYALGTFATPFIPPLMGLDFVFIAYALPILLLQPLIYWSAAGIGDERGPMLPIRAYIAAFRSPELWRLGLAFAGTYAIYIFYTSWTPSLLVRQGGIPLETAGALAALVPAFGILSRPLGGYLADTTLRRDKRLAPIASFLILLPLSLLWTTGSALSWAPILLPMAGFLVQLPFSVYYAFSSQILPERLSGSAYTFMNTTSLVGGAVTPYLAGHLLDITGSFGPQFLLAAGPAAMGLLLTITSRER